MSTLPSGIVLVAVTKNHPSGVITEAAKAGIEHIAENRVQEAKHKLEEIGKCGLVWHLIGHLQTNKVRVAVGIFDVIESVDSIHLMRVLNEEAARISKVQDILLQLNLTCEPQKTGFGEADYREALALLPEFANLRVRGLMVIAKDVDDPEEMRPVFRRAREMFLQLQRVYPVDVLSMGMTNDYRVAIEEGSTEIRLGRALFGERDYSIKY